MYFCRPRSRTVERSPTNPKFVKDLKSGSRLRGRPTAHHYCPMTAPALQPQDPQPTAAPAPAPVTGSTRAVSGKWLVGYGLGALGVSAVVTYILAELATLPGVGVLTADLSGLGRSVGLIAAAAVAVPGAILAYHRQRALDQANTLVEQQHQHKITADNRADTLATKQHDHKVLTDQREHIASTERNLRDRYTTTAAQLAHESGAIRLAGVYALASLADDWHTFGNNDERQVCIDLLCAYLRTEPPKPRRSGIDTSTQVLEGHEESVAREEQHVRTAIINTIRIRTTPKIEGDRGVWETCQFDLSRANLTESALFGANLPRANLTESNLAGSYMSNTNLTGVSLHGADLTSTFLPSGNLTRAHLTEANLTDSYLVDVNLTSARLNDANLTGANLSSANLTNAFLPSANLINARLTEANLNKANLTGAKLNDANLKRANLTGANLTGANLTSANLTGVEHDNETIWPEDFDQTRLGSR